MTTPGTGGGDPPPGAVVARRILRETPEARADARERLGDGRRRAEVDVLARLHGWARGTEASPSADPREPRASSARRHTASAETAGAVVLSRRRRRGWASGRGARARAGLGGAPLVHRPPDRRMRRTRGREGRAQSRGAISARHPARPLSDFRTLAAANNRSRWGAMPLRDLRCDAARGAMRVPAEGLPRPNRSRARDGRYWGGGESRVS